MVKVEKGTVKAESVQMSKMRLPKLKHDACIASRSGRGDLDIIKKYHFIISINKSTAGG
jgi:hypothetical protein